MGAFADMLPWEFRRDFVLVRTAPPPRRENANGTGRPPRTRWVVDDPPDAADGPPVPGVHYVVVSSVEEGDAYFVLESDPEDEHFKHQWVIEQRCTPVLPVLRQSPMPNHAMSKESASLSWGPDVVCLAWSQGFAGPAK